jgi:hypothetical protein
VCSRVVVLTKKKAYLVSSSDTDNHLDGIGREVTTVTSDDEGGTLGTSLDGIEGGLDEVLGVVFLLENLDALAETTGAWSLVVKGSGGD